MESGPKASIRLPAEEIKRAFEISTAFTGDSIISTLRVDIGDGQVEFLGPGAGYVCIGESEGRAATHVSATLARDLAFTFRDGELVELSIEPGWLKIGPMRLQSSSAMDIAPEPLLLPIGADLHDILLAIEIHGHPRVMATVGEKALIDFRRRLENVIHAAGQALAPLRISDSEIRVFIRIMVENRAAAIRKASRKPE